MRPGMLDPARDLAGATPETLTRALFRRERRILHAGRVPERFGLPRQHDLRAVDRRGQRARPAPVGVDALHDSPMRPAPALTSPTR